MISSVAGEGSVAAEMLLVFLPRGEDAQGRWAWRIHPAGPAQGWAISHQPRSCSAALEQRRNEKLERICFTWQMKGGGNK